MYCSKESSQVTCFLFKLTHQTESTDWHLDGHMYSILFGLTHQAESTGGHLDGPGGRTVQFRTQQEWLVNLHHIQGLKLSKWTTSKYMFIKPNITVTDIIHVQDSEYSLCWSFHFCVSKFFTVIITKCLIYYKHSKSQKVGCFNSDIWYMDLSLTLKIFLPSWTGVWQRPQRG